MLDWNKFDDQLIKITNKDEYNLLQLACIYNDKSVQVLINCKYDITELFNGKMTFDNKSIEPAIFLATMYNPEALKCILDSKYCTKEMYEMVYNNVTILDEAFNNQPKSLRYIIQSKHATESVFIQRKF